MKQFNIAALAVATAGVLHVKTATGEPAYADEERKLPLRITVKAGSCLEVLEIKKAAV